MNRGAGVAAGVVLGLAVLVGAAFYLLREQTPPMVAAPAAPVVSPAPRSVPLAPATPLPRDATAATAAAAAASNWNLPSSAAPSPAAPLAPEPGRAGAPTIAQIQSRLQAIVASKQPNIAELDSVLVDLEKNQGGSVIAGVDISALRDNLARANRIQLVALEVQTLSAAAPGPDTTARLQAKVNEIQQLQSGMRAVTVPTAAVAPGPTPVAR